MLKINSTPTLFQQLAKSVCDGVGGGRISLFHITSCPGGFSQEDPESECPLRPHLELLISQSRELQLGGLVVG